MKIDSHLNDLLWRWGRQSTSISLGYPTVAAGFQEYQTKGYPNPPRYDPDELDKLSGLIDKLNELQINALKCRYRIRVKLKRGDRRMSKKESARHLDMPVQAYQDLCDQCIKILSEGMNG